MTVLNDIVWDAQGNDELCVNKSRAKKKTYAKRFPRGHWSFLDLKRRGTQLTIANQMDLGIELQKNAAEFRRNRSSYIPWHQCLGERRIKKQRKWKEVNTLQWQHQNVELLLQVVLSVDQLSIFGAVADMTEELPVGRRALGKPVASSQLDKQEILTQRPLAKMQANEERQRNLLQEYEQRFEKLSEDQKLSRLCSEAGSRLVEVGQFFYTFPSPRGKTNHSLCREYTLPRDQKRTRIKGWIQSNVRFGPVSDPKVCNQYGRYSIEVQVQSLFKDQTESWIRIVNGIDKFARETMPFQEEEKASVKPDAKARPILKPSSTSGWGFTPMEKKQWIDIKNKNPKIRLVLKCQNSLLNYFNSQKVDRQDDGAVH